MVKIRIECIDCSGTGLYSGFCEGPGVAVICLGCNGTGCQEKPYTPYTGRKIKHGIKTIRRSAGRFIATGVGGQGESMTYAQFEKLIPAAPK